MVSLEKLFVKKPYVPILMRKLPLAILGSVLLATPSYAALVAQFSFESDFSNSIAGGATAAINSTSTPLAGQTAVGNGKPNTGNVMRLDGGQTAPVDGLTIGINLGQGTNTSLTSIGDNFTLSAWYCIDTDHVANNDTSNPKRHFLWEGANNSYDVSYNGNPTTGNGQSYTQGADSNTLIANAATPGQWFHVTQTYQASGSNILITTYINGVPHATVLSSLNVDAGDFNVQGLNIGMHRALGRAFDGQIDELKIWDETLSASAVQAEFLASVPEPSVALLGGLGVLALLRRRRA